MKEQRRVGNSALQALMKAFWPTQPYSTLRKVCIGFLDHNAPHLIKRDHIGCAVIEFGCARTFVRSHGLGADSRASRPTELCKTTFDIHGRYPRGESLEKR
jgi:hypothetical protein